MYLYINMYELGQKIDISLHFFLTKEVLHVQKEKTQDWKKIRGMNMVETRKSKR